MIQTNFKFSDYNYVRYEKNVHGFRKFCPQSKKNSNCSTSISLESRLYPHQETKILNNFVSSNDVRFVSSLDKVRSHED